MSKPMHSDEFLSLCKKEIVKYYKETYDYIEGATKTLTADDVYVVWYSKSLQNHKAILSTTIPDGTYFELTYNGDKHELYFDAYKKWKNNVFLFQKLQSMILHPHLSQLKQNKEIGSMNLINKLKRTVKGKE